VPKRFDIKSLETIAIAGVGLLGGSIGLGLRAAGFTGRRIGLGRRASSLRHALDFDAVDEVTRDPRRGVAEAQLVVICTPIGQFEPVLREMAEGVRPGTVVTDVASAKVQVMRLGRELLPRSVPFIGSHPMAGSEKSGVEYSRADLFDRATCIVTPPPRASKDLLTWVCGFWETLGARTVVLPAPTHDRLLARISHLPHAVASALVALSRRQDAIALAGPGFADTTRIASGDAALWTDIFRANSDATVAAVDELMQELQRFRKLVQRDDVAGIMQWLSSSKEFRDRWVAQRYRKQVLAP
jgi:prephenate dehydrogenase